MKLNLRYLVVWTTFSGGFVSTGSGAELRLAVAVNNQARFEDAVVAKAEAIADGIFGDLGVQVEWLDITGAGKDGHGSDEAVRRADFLLNLSRVRGAVMGYGGLGLAILRGEGRSGYLIYVFRPSVEDLVQEYLARHGPRPGLRGALMGYVIAHEIGHQLLGTMRHSDSGIMRTKWDHDEIQRAYQGRLRFSDAQTEKIREAVRARSDPAKHRSLGQED